MLDCRNENEVYSVNYVYQDDIMYLPKRYHDIYQESREEEFKHGQIVADDLVRMLNFMRKNFSKLSFDFMSCFYFDKENGKFTPHKEEYKSCCEDESLLKALVKFPVAWGIFVAVSADKLFTECLWQAFQLSSHFSSKLRVLNLRGFTQLKSSTI